jgi:hypothetical protein
VSTSLRLRPAESYDFGSTLSASGDHEASPNYLLELSFSDPTSTLPEHSSPTLQLFAGNYLAV